MKEPTLTREPHFWGQLLMVGIPGPRVEEVARGLVRDLRVGELSRLPGTWKARSRSGS